MSNSAKKWISHLLILIFINILLSSCKKLIEIEPPKRTINAETVFADNNTAISVLTGLYVDLAGGNSGSGDLRISLYGGLSSDEFTLFNGYTGTIYNEYYRNSLISTPVNSVGGEIWNDLYTYIFRTNAAIEGLSASNSLSDNTKNQLLGEAKFLRAFFYFYLVNFYGDVPMPLETDPKINSKLLRKPVNDVYGQIIIDLREAQTLLKMQYVDINLSPYQISSAERVRPNSWTATALLSRVYLYTNDYNNAELEASKIISEKNLYDLQTLNQAFLKNNKEAIWQIQPVRTNRNANDAFTFIIPNAGPNSSTNYVFLSQQLLGSFESGDQRAIIGNWINSVTPSSGIEYSYPFKYKVTTNSTISEYNMVLRLGEQYLIRAEARAQLGKLSGANSALEDINIIRSRAGLQGKSSSTNKQDVLDMILHERRVELFTEWGHRWLDLKRTKKIDDVMNNIASAKNIEWKSYQQLYPIPFNDIQRAPQLIQNPGY